MSEYLGVRVQLTGFSFDAPVLHSRLLFRGVR
jgi:hypothetical protein